MVKKEERISRINKFEEDHDYSCKKWDKDRIYFFLVCLVNTNKKGHSIK